MEAVAAWRWDLPDYGLDPGLGPGEPEERATALLRLFLKNRWLGLWPILYGDQVRQTALDNWIFQGTLDVEHLPPPDPSVRPEPEVEKKAPVAASAQAGVES